MTGQEKFVVYWCGFEENPPAIQSLPTGIDVVNLFLLNLHPSSSGTTLTYRYITSKGTSWDDILGQAKAAQAKGVKVCASLLPPGPNLIWNSIPDPDVFAKNVYDLITQWGLDGIDIDPEQGSGIVCNQTFVDVVESLSKYFGPKSDTGLMMTFVTYIPSNDEPVLKPCSGMFDYVMTMGYFWSYHTMTQMFDQYAEIVGGENLLIGVSPSKTSIDDAKSLAQWEPSSGRKGGMMEFDVGSDTNYQMATTIIGSLPSAG